MLRFSKSMMVFPKRGALDNGGFGLIWWPTASQAAAQARNRSAQQSAAASSITGMSLQEAQQILNISTLNPEEIQKVRRVSTRLHKIFRNIMFAWPFPVCSCHVSRCWFDSYTDNNWELFPIQSPSCQLTLYLSCVVCPFFNVSNLDTFCLSEVRTPF